MGLKLIMALSADGFLCRGPDDDMSWTGREDKALFKTLTLTGGVMGAGSRTFDLLPELPGRRLVRLSTHDGGEDCSDGHRMSLDMFPYRYPGAWLLGGPTVACEALERYLVDEVVLIQSRHTNLGGVGSSSPPLIPMGVLLRRMNRLDHVGQVGFECNSVSVWRTP